MKDIKKLYLYALLLVPVALAVVGSLFAWTYSRQNLPSMNNYEQPEDNTTGLEGTRVRTQEVPSVDYYTTTGGNTP